MTYSDFNPLLQREEKHFLAPSQARLVALQTALVFKLNALPPTIQIVDLSHWNTVSSFKQMKAAGIGAVIFKATEGNAGVDDKFPLWWPQALDAGLEIGVYHFFRSQFSGSQQALWFLKHIEGLRAATHDKLMPLWVDVETADGQTQAIRAGRLADCLSLLKNEFGRSGTYSSKALWDQLIGNVAWGKEYYGWIAHWMAGTTPAIPACWNKDKVLLHQIGVYPKYSWCFPAPDTVGEVDCNRFYGTPEDLCAWVGKDPRVTLEERVELLEQRVSRLELRIS